MKKITLNAYAKINLSLDVLGTLENGYHKVDMIMQQIELHDTVNVAWSKALSSAVKQITTAVVRWAAFMMKIKSNNHFSFFK